MWQFLAIGDFVVRKSHNGDLIFRIISLSENTALLRGTCLRVMADAPLNDLIKVDTDYAKAQKEHFKAAKSKSA